MGMGGGSSEHTTAGQANRSLFGGQDCYGQSDAKFMSLSVHWTNAHLEIG